MENSNKKLNTGDWVLGKTRDGELIRGFIENSDFVQNISKVYVVESDNEQIVRKSIWVINKSLEKLAPSKGNAEELLSLIDLALLTKDEQWFMELSSIFNTVSKHSSKARERAVSAESMNEFSEFDTKH